MRELLGRATLLRARGQRQEALELAQQAVSIDDASWEAHELIGDLLVELGREELALESYRRARALNASRRALEDKLARAALARAARQRAASMSEALLSGKGRPSSLVRKPGYAALASAIAPGLGQVYNGEVAKGFVLLVLFLISFFLTGASLRAQTALGPLSPQGSLYGPRVDLGSLLAGLFSGVSALWVILLLVVWVYAIADAAIRASRTGTSDDTGLV
jgi:tetratricopeptide (TPR) repeat protein